MSLTENQTLPPRDRTIPLARLARLVVFLGLPLVAATPASALLLDCDGPAVSLDVEVEPAAGRCAVDGTEASLRKPYDPVVCHLSTPQLQILTIARDGSFTWEDTASARVERGMCAGL